MKIGVYVLLASLSSFFVSSQSAAMGDPQISTPPSGTEKPITLSNTEPGGRYNECIARFYDREMYNWLSFRNNCTIALNVTYRWLNGQSGGLAEVDPGDKTSTGATASEAREKGGTTLAICRKGWIPEDGESRPWMGGPYRCRQYSGD